MLHQFVLHALLLGCGQTAAAPVVAPASTSTTLFSWLRNKGAQIGPVQLQTSTAGDGSGVFVTRDCEQGEVLFSVPVQALSLIHI